MEINPNDVLTEITDLENLIVDLSKKLAEEVKEINGGPHASGTISECKRVIDKISCAYNTLAILKRLLS
tara:strand:- start:31 stop:237 length:207 start_codon:yes stop_codon:yes gene_type:complete